MFQICSVDGLIEVWKLQEKKKPAFHFLRQEGLTFQKEFLCTWWRTAIWPISFSADWMRPTHIRKAIFFILTKSVDSNVSLNNNTPQSHVFENIWRHHDIVRVTHTFSYHTAQLVQRGQTGLRQELGFSSDPGRILSLLELKGNILVELEDCLTWFLVFSLIKTLTCQHRGVLRNMLEIFIQVHYSGSCAKVLTVLNQYSSGPCSQDHLVGDVRRTTGCSRVNLKVCLTCWKSLQYPYLC